MRKKFHGFILAFSARNFGVFLDFMFTEVGLTMKLGFATNPQTPNGYYIYFYVLFTYLFMYLFIYLFVFFLFSLLIDLFIYISIFE